MKRDRLLYISHVPWGWIKQRPQFIAEHLTEYVDTNLLELRSLIPRFYKKVNLNYNKPSNITLKKVTAYRLPMYDPMYKMQSRFLDFLNNILLTLSIRFKSYKYVWVTSVVAFYKFKDIIPKRSVLIFDCMDDELEFPSISSNDNFKEVYKQTEKELLTRANYVVCSSQNLKNVLLNRNNTSRDIIVMNNASSYPNKDDHNFSLRDNFKLNSDKVHIVYIGTISEWFDFSSILYLLDERVNTELVLVGPKETNIPIHPRIKWLGTCYHEEIWGIMKRSSVLIMPFKLNPLIESVNPVKLYEYIWSNKPVIATRYKESEKFNDYVFLFSNKEELLYIYDKVCQDGFRAKATIEDNHKFIKTNTWEFRIKELSNIIFKK